MTLSWYRQTTIDIPEEKNGLVDLFWEKQLCQLSSASKHCPKSHKTRYKENSVSQIDLSQNWRSGTHLSPPLLPGSSLKVGGLIRETWWFPSWRTWPQWRGPSQKQTVLRFRLDPKCSRQEPGKVKIERRRPRSALDKSPKNQLNWKILDPEVLSHYPGNSVLPGGKRVRKREPRCTSASCKRAAEADRSLLWNPRAQNSNLALGEKRKTEKRVTCLVRQKLGCISA